MQTLLRTNRIGRLWLNPNRVAQGIVVIFVLLGLLYSMIVPSWEAPDERDHFAYAMYVREHVALPVQNEKSVATAHHPPLFYILAAIASLPVDNSNVVGAYRSNRNFLFAPYGGRELNRHVLSTGDTFPYAGWALALHLMRWLSLVFGAGAVWLTYKFASELLPGQSAIACFATALVAFNPQFVFISAAAMNDGLLAFAATGLLWSLVRAMRQPSTLRRWFIVGVWMSLAAMSKISGLAFAPIVAVGLLICAIQGRSINLLVRGGLVLTLPILVLTGWWFIRNFVLYEDILGTSAWLKHFPGAIRNSPIDWPTTTMQILRSAWAVFGWMTVAAPGWVFTGIWALLGFSIVGLAVYGLKQLRHPPRMWPAAAWAAIGCLILVLYQIGLMVRENLQWITASQGRYFFPVIAPAMVLVSLGWGTLLPARVRPYVLSAVALFLLALAIFLPVAVIGPNFRMPQTLPRSSLWFARHPWHADFGQQLGLRAFDYEVDPAQRNRLHLKLYWTALAKPSQNYSTFAHVLSAADVSGSALLGQHDQVPGAQIDYTPTSWAQDDLVLDERDIQLNTPLNNGSYIVRLGVYNYESGERLPVQSNQAQTDFVLLPIYVSTLP